RFRNYRRLMAALGIICAMALLSGIVWHDLARSESPPANRPIAAKQPGYVTSNSCRACHPGNYASWHTSFHRTMTQVASPTTVLADVRDTELSFGGRQYKLSREGDKFFVS